jgi:hypothetical protein
MCRLENRGNEAEDEEIEGLIVPERFYLWICF